MTRSPSSVAVVLTCYNEGRYIGAAVRSVLAQTCADSIESIVIADDGSGPETIVALREIESWDGRIKILYGPGGAGLPAQRNIAISNCSAPFIAILDGDDYWTSNKLEAQLPLLADGVGLVYSAYYAFARDDESTAALAKVLDITRAPDLVRSYFLSDPPIIPSTTLIRRTAYEASGKFDAEIKVFEDTDFYLRMAQVCRFAFAAAPLLYKRSNERGITGARKDLMAHHAFVALKAASRDPRLLPLVPVRLAERARKLGNHRFLLGDTREAQYLLRLAVRLNALNLRAWLSLLATLDAFRPLRRMFSGRVRARRLAIGAVEPLQ